MFDEKIAPVPAPFETDRLVVRPDWIDSNGHMNIAFYVKAFDEAIDEFYNFLGLDGDSIQRTGVTVFTVEKHITYQRELHLGDRLRIATQVIDFNERRLHLIQTMYHADEGYLAATDEWLIMCVDFRERRAIPFPPRLIALLTRVKAAHAALPRPPELGRRIDLANKRPR